MIHRFELSVHDIVDTLYRKGHLDSRVFNQSSMQEGTRLHALYQSSQTDGYISEYPLSYTFQQEDYIYHVTGRADGVLISSEGDITVEEIKTTVADLDEFILDHGQWHLSQAMFYAYILSKEKNVKSVSVLMTYIKQQNSAERKQVRNLYTAEELEQFVTDSILRYTRYQKKVQHFKQERNESIKDLPFPFPTYRQGQKDMISFVSHAAEFDETVYVEAPTGIGKTLSVLYPLVCRFALEKQDRIFYLTSKNSIKKIAMSALAMFKRDGAKCKSIEFTSQENICFNDKKGRCNPDECPFARHYYDKLLDAIFDALSLEDTFSRKTIEDLCYERQMCPFQFQLDLSPYCDVLVCDYTYVYDYHDRLGLQEGALANSKNTLCVDECHNLPDRVRDMYSIELDKSLFKEALSYCGRKEFKALKADLKEIIKYLDEYVVDDTDEDVAKLHLEVIAYFARDLLEPISNFLVDFKALLLKHPNLIEEGFLEFFYQINSFSYLAQLLEDEETRPSFLCYYRVDDEHKISGLRITNLNSRSLIKEAGKSFQSIIYFSATLSPKEYYIDLLGGRISEENNLFLPSPFPIENRRVFIDSRLSLRYKDRKQTLPMVYNLCVSTIKTKKGNYFIFCPSFDYLDELSNMFANDESFTSRVIVQGRGMKESQREDFLAQFEDNPDETLVGLLVLGGIFSEGIDMLGERLIGAIIISAGLPQINFERDCVKRYYDTEDEEKKGFYYAYTYPGINKILQAGGRVIRSDLDKGFIIYIDSRFSQPLYRSLFKEIYPDAKKVISPSQVTNLLKQFWKEQE